MGYYEDLWNHPYPDPRLHLGAASIGVNHMPYFDMTLRSNNLPPSNFFSEIPSGPNHIGGVNPGSLHDHFPQPPSVNCSNLLPSNYSQGGPPCYDSFAVNSHMDYGRVQQPYKRKTPAIPMAFDVGNNYSYHSAGSSSSLSVPSVNLQANHMAGPQYLPWDSNDAPSSYRENNVLPDAEGSQRNVRSRQSLALHFGNIGTETLQPSNLHFHPAGQWGHTPPSFDYDRRILAPGHGSFGHEMNQPLTINNNINDSMEIDRGYHHNSFLSSAPLPIPHPHSSQIVSAGRSSYDQRTHYFRDASSYQPAAFSAPTVEGRRAGVEDVTPRYPRPLTITGRNSERNGRLRVDRLQPFLYGNHAHNGSIPQRIVYDSRDFLDQHHDMRLDIDNMSYEELLALEERIGNVNTGLSGDSVSRCLVETVYVLSSQQDNDEERNCAVCLEEYEDEENVGRLACGHDFHSNCIKKWLSIKDACPICKASALSDRLTER